MIISLPESKRVNSAEVVSTMDLLPTICDLVGADTPKNIDGISLADLLNGKARKDATRTLYWDTGAQRAIRKGKWKLLVTEKAPSQRLQITPSPKGFFLYDLLEDPQENRDLSSHYPEIMADLSKELATWQSKVFP